MGAREVHLVCLESREEMPASEEEIEEGLVEGIKIHPSLGPKQFVGKNGKVTGLEVIRCTSVFDAQRRFSPTFAPGTETILPCDTVILAIGQASDLSFLKPADGIETTRQGTLKIDPATLMTTAPGIFAAGDIAFGPRLIINAVADGKKAAEEIDKFIRGTRMEAQVPSMCKSLFSIITKWPSSTTNIPAWLYLSSLSNAAPASPKSRLGSRKSRRGAKLRAACNAGSIRFSKAMKPKAPNASCAGDAWMFARRTACSSSRSANLGFPMKHADSSRRLPIRARWNSSTSRPTELITEEGSVMVKDETICIRCGLCAERCPVKTITMEAFEVFDREPNLVQIEEMVLHA